MRFSWLTLTGLALETKSSKSAHRRRLNDCSLISTARTLDELLDYSRSVTVLSDVVRLSGAVACTCGR